MYDEFVVYDPNQAIPRYIVHYKNLIFYPAAMQPSQSADQNLIQIKYKMSPNFRGDSPEEYHFRLAESQFFRMSSRNEYKVVMVELIRNKRLQMQYEEAKKELGREKKNVVEERLVFHGTEKEAIEKIIEEGFKIGGEGVAVRNGRAYGSGLYTAENPDISIPYSKGGTMMLLSSALLGEHGKDYSNGASPDVLVLKRAQHFLPKYIVHYAKKRFMSSHNI